MDSFIWRNQELRPSLSLHWFWHHSSKDCSSKYCPANLPKCRKCRMTLRHPSYDLHAPTVRSAETWRWSEREGWYSWGSTVARPLQEAVVACNRGYWTSKRTCLLRSWQVEGNLKKRGVRKWRQMSEDRDRGRAVLEGTKVRDEM